MRLDDRKLNIPSRRTPVYWNADMRPEMNLAVVGRYMAKYTEMLPLGEGFDEVAILLPDPFRRSVLHRDLVADGWDSFNEASDIVYTNPFGTRYAVSYEFFRKEGIPYRIEAMCLDYDEFGDAGFSPLHRALLGKNGTYERNSEEEDRLYPIPHLSYKPTPRKLRYPSLVTAEMGAAPGTVFRQSPGQAYGSAVQHLKDKAFIHAMTCQSSYGNFGYFIHRDEQKQIYVKPRINTRDDA